MAITFVITSSKPATSKTDVLIVPVASSSDLKTLLPAGAARAAQQRLKQLGWRGEAGSAELLVAPKGLTAQFLAVISLGDGNSLPPTEVLRRGIGKVLRDCRHHALRHIVLALPESESAREYAAAAAEAALLGAYQFSQYSKRLTRAGKTRGLKSFTLLTNHRQLAAVSKAVADIRQVMSGVALARDLVNQPASAVTPASLVALARDIQKKSKQISVTVLDKAVAAKQNFSAFLAVAKGSQEEPYVIHLKYQPSTEPSRKIFLVGKGITFDSGGLSIKPADGMMTMKLDMAGAAAVLGVFSILEKIKPNIEIHGVIAACENMPSGSAYRPGDVVRAKNGKTIEVLNTDAEGRITLADTLSFAAEHQPDAIIDVATLTGACMVALGDTQAGLWGNNQELKEKLMAAAQERGEGLVAMPLVEEYKQFIQSQVADLRNVTNTRLGGAITAALFLQEFVGKIPWAHIDMAGPAFLERQSLPYFSEGATGYGVRTLAQFLKNY